MADEYTPTTEDVENCYVYAGANPDGSLVSPPVERAFRAAFTRWLVAHDREVAAKALRDAADRIDRHPWGDYLMATPGGLLRALAAETEMGASDG